MQVLSRPPFFLEPKPQQTGTGLLIRYGEVATTSGSTNLFASWCNSSMPGFDPDGLVQIQARQPTVPLGGEIGSCLAYTQKSKGQNLPERLTFVCWLRLGGPFARGVI